MSLLKHDPSPPPVTYNTASRSTNQQLVPSTAGKQNLSTPSNRGTSHMAQSGSSVVLRKELAPYIREDIRLRDNRIRVHFVDFLASTIKESCALDSNADATSLLQNVVKVTTELYNDSKFDKARKNLTKYCEARTDEKLGYLHITRCVNEAFRLLKDETFSDLKDLSSLHDIFLHDNHTLPLEHVYGPDKLVSTRYPDLTIMTKRLYNERKGRAQKLRRSEWGDSPSAWEAKLQGKQGFPAPPDQYSAASATEYYALHDSELTKNDKCASQIYKVKDGGDALKNPNDNFMGPLFLSQPKSSLVLSSTDESVEESPSQHPSDSSDVSQPVQATSDTHSPPSQLPPDSNKVSSSNKSATTTLKRKADDQPATSSFTKRMRYELKDPIPNEQISIYGCEALCRGFYMLHSINLLIVDDLVWLWRFDRQNVIQTSGLNFVQDMPYFLALLVAFQRFDLADWGVEPSLVPNTMFIQKDSTLNHSVEVEFDNGVKANVIHPKVLALRGPVLKGRGTSIIPAESHSINPSTRRRLTDEELVIKAYWPETTRYNESDIITKAYKAVQDSDEELLKHLPKLIATHDFSSSDTSKILRQIRASAASKSPNPRILRLLLFRRLVPLDSIEDEGVFMKALLQCFKCHYSLWKKGIEHGDISVWNLMWDEREKCGVLNDFDLSVVKTDGISHHRGGDRTGTLPFMARRILDDAFMSGSNERLYEFELESFIWVYAWLCLRGVPITDSTYEWRYGTFKAVDNGKWKFLLNFHQLKLKSPYKRAWRSCFMLLVFLKELDLAMYPVDIFMDDFEDDLQDKPRAETTVPHVQFNIDDIYSEVLTIMENPKYRPNQVISFIENAKTKACVSS